MFDDKSILITGGSGSLGRALTKRLLHFHRPRRVIVFSRGEKAQGEMRQMFPESQYPPIRFYIGDVRDYARLKLAFTDVDYVVHAAAVKEVPTCEKDIWEAIKTNVGGAENVQRAAIDMGVRRVVALSTDKASSPVTAYGATKLLSDKSFVRGNVYAAGTQTSFVVVRYGNVACSRGSVIPLFLSQRQYGEVTITDEHMTRFWMSMEDAVDAILWALENCLGGEIVVPKMPSFRITDLAEAVAPGCRRKIVGIRLSEKLHEQLWSPEESRQVYDCGAYYVIYPETVDWTLNYGILKAAKQVPEGFSYRSDTNGVWLSSSGIRELLQREGIDV